MRIGQAWRAASLQGHKIADDLNLSSPTATAGQLTNRTGNKLLSLWKSNAWNLSSNVGSGDWKYGRGLDIGRNGCRGEMV